GNNAFAPPTAAGSAVNILGGAGYPRANVTATGWSADYAPMCQVKTVKDASGAPIGLGHPIVVAALPWAGQGSPGAMKQNGFTRMMEIRDGASNTSLYSEAAGRTQLWFAGRVSTGPTNTTGAIWADSDNRITITGTDATGLLNAGKGPCAMNCSNV